MLLYSFSVENVCTPSSLSLSRLYSLESCLAFDGGMLWGPKGHWRALGDPDA